MSQSIARLVSFHYVVKVWLFLLLVTLSFNFCKVLEAKVWSKCATFDQGGRD